VEESVTGGVKSAKVDAPVAGWLVALCLCGNSGGIDKMLLKPELPWASICSRVTVEIDCGVSRSGVSVFVPVVAFEAMYPFSAVTVTVLPAWPTLRTKFAVEDPLPRGITSSCESIPKPGALMVSRYFAGRSLSWYEPSAPVWTCWRNAPQETSTLADAIMAPDGSVTTPEIDLGDADEEMEQFSEV